MTDDLRKLDAEFAEKVLGLTPRWKETNEPQSPYDLSCPLCRCSDVYDDFHDCSYSVSLTAAWAGVEKVGARTIHLWAVGDDWFCSVHIPDIPQVDGAGATPAEALCRALIEATVDKHGGE